jgi:hypothetical protein
MMKKRFLFPLINLGTLIGCALALFTVPPDTSVRLFLFVSLAAIAAINATLIYKLRRRKSDIAPNPSDKLSSVIIWIGFAVFLFEVIRGAMKYWHQP